MDKSYIPSEPFADITEHAAFTTAFCDRCKKYKVDDELIPLIGNCKIEEAAVYAMMMPHSNTWPKDDIVQTGKLKHICLHFQSDSAATMENYRTLLEGEVKPNG